MNIAVGNLDTDNFGVFVSLVAIDLPVAIVDVAGDVLGKTMACFAKAVATSIDFERLNAGRALSSVVFEVVETPGLGGCQGPRETVVGCWSESNGFGRRRAGRCEIRRRIVRRDLDDHRPHCRSSRRHVDGGGCGVYRYVAD